MKVICAGMSKTGTKSMHVALEMLGYSNVYDYPEHLKFEKDLTGFALKGWTTDDFRRIYAKADAAVDNPSCYFWEELLQAFPDAKVILMVRDDQDIWYESIKHQVEAFNGPHLYFYAVFGGSAWRQFQNYINYSGTLSVGNTMRTIHLVQWIFSPEMIAKQMYRRQNAHVINTCPKDKLLVFNVKEGWIPLCKFLEKPVPREPFPKVNVRGAVAQDMWEMDFFKKAKKEAWTNFGLTCLTAAVAAVIVRSWVARR